ncbi:hypothetical protein [Dietzia maris]|uniref:hypothetical protein n=1 Tax=Dietzia maris TaxID=37915 RepID=UPI00223AAFBC|nr:hypothetical protein [Dietzia maris]MCT1434393.1 hypothetical protein [Dietzia maris]MCT1521482.1 hypothetical protein [Dietzia maris]
MSKNFRATVSPDNVRVRYPASVNPGEVFTVYVQPGVMSTASGSSGGYGLGRLAYDIAFPSDLLNAVPLSAVNNGGDSGFTSDATALKVERADASGAIRADGGFARVWGGSSVVLGNNDSGTWLNDWQGGLQVPGNGATFRFPEVAMKMRAPVTSGGQTISVGLKGAGTSGSLTDGTVNGLSGAEKSGYFGSWLYTLRFHCGASANAGSLTNTVVAADTIENRYIAKTSTRLLSEGTHLPRSARSATLSAEVTTTEEVMKNVQEGGAVMRFDIRDLSTDSIIASPTGTINANGIASVSHQFPDISSGEFRDNYEVTATYTGRPGNIASSSSGSTTFSVGYNEINATVNLKSTNGQISGTPRSMPVTLTADLSLPSGRTFPAGMSIQLYRNGVAHGNAISLSSGGNTKSVQFPTDVLVQEENTTAYRYTAVLSPVIINDLDRYAGQTAVPVAAIVTGSDPGSVMPGGGHGSLDLTEFFKVPALAWEAIGGSVGEMGTLSVSMTR